MIELALRLVLAGTFLYAGFAKIQDPSAFASQIAAYRLLPEAAARGLAVLLPPLEILCGLLLLLGRWLLGSSGLAAGLLAIFILAMASAILRGLRIDCGCFSVSGGHQVSYTRILEDGILLAAAIFVWWQNAAKLHALPSTPHREG